MKIFVINLKRSNERRVKMQEKLSLLKENPIFAELGLSYHFFNAIDSKSEEFKQYKAMFDSICCYLLHGRILIDSEIACYASHYSLWNECVRINEAIVILEDDIVFESNFLSALKDIMNTTFPLIRFFTLDRKRDKYVYQIDNSNYHYSLKNTNGLQGYYITPKAAKELLKQTTFDSPVDIYVESVARHNVDNIIYKPFLIGESDIAMQSTIVNSDGSHRANNGGGGVIPLHYKILKPIYRTYIQSIRAVFKLFYKPPSVVYQESKNYGK